MHTKIQTIINELTHGAALIENTVDGLIHGSPDTEVTGVVVTFLATHHILVKAKKLGANLVISHEGLFYSHRPVDYSYDDVYKMKMKVIEESGMAVFRLHDHIHRVDPDGITSGLIKALDWADHVLENRMAASLLSVPEMTLGEMIGHLKNKLGVKTIRVLGDLSMTCRKIGVLVGYRGSGDQVIPLFAKENLDAVIIGEGMEWEAPQYVRDALQQGLKKAMIVLGHEESETPGMRLLAEDLQKKFPDVPFWYIGEESLFQTF